MSTDGVEVSVVLPAYNEEKIIEDTISRTLRELESFLPAGSFEVVVAENGSTDDTEAIVDRIAAQDDRVWYVTVPDAGRGHALNETFRQVNGDTVAYLDADLATDMRHLEELVESVRTDGYDVVTGSRYLDASDATRTAKRLSVSKVFNFLARGMLGSQLEDHQCGFKAFRRDAIVDLVDDVQDDHWFWDTEVLAKAQARGLSVKEFPVEWIEKGDSKVDLVRDVLGMGSQLVRTGWELRVQPRLSHRVSIAAGLLVTVLAVVLGSYYLDYSEVLAAMRAADYRYLVPATLVYALTFPLRGVRYRDILDRLGHFENPWFLTGAVCISQTANFVVPARGGDAVRAYVIKSRRRIPFTSGFASLTIERLFDLSIIAILGGLSLLALGSGGVTTMLDAYSQAPADVQRAASYGGILAGVVAAVSLSAAALIAITSRYDVPLRVPFLSVDRFSTDSYVTFVQDVLRRFVGDIQHMGGDWRAISLVSASTALIWVLDVATGLIVLAAFDVAVPTTTLLAVGTLAIAVGTLSKVLPLTPGGIGLYEGVFTFIFVALTPVTWSVALSAAIVDHALKNGTTILGGVISVLKLNVSLVEVIDESENVDANQPLPKDT